MSPGNPFLFPVYGAGKGGRRNILPLKQFPNEEEQGIQKTQFFQEHFTHPRVSGVAWGSSLPSDPQERNT